MLFERMAEQAKRETPEQLAKKAKIIEEEIKSRTKRGRYVFIGVLGSVFGGISLALTAKMRQESQAFPSRAFYAYKKKLLTGRTLNETIADEQSNQQEQGQALESSSSSVTTTKKQTLSSWLRSNKTEYDNCSYSEMLVEDQFVDKNKFVASAILGGALSLMFFYGVFRRRLIKCPDDSYLIVFRKYRSHDFDNGIFNEMLEPGQVRFVKPIFEGYGFLNNSDVPVKLNKYCVETKDQKKVMIDLEMNVGVGKAATEVCFASSKHLDKSVTELSNMAQRIMQDALRDTVKNFESSEIESNSDDFHIHLQQLTAWYMKFIGLYVRDCALLGYETGPTKVVRKDLKKPGQENEEEE